MGANNSTRRVSFESDDYDNVTVVKGIRLSENVIKRMKGPAAPSKQNNASSPPPTISAPPLLQPVPPLVDPFTSLPPPLPLVAPPSAAETAAAPPQPPTEKPTVEPLSPAPVFKPVARAESSPAPPPAAAVVNEEALRKKITDELSKGFEQDRAKAKQEMQAWFDAEKARTSAQAQTAAQSQVQAEVSRMLSAERAVAQENFQQAVIRERITTEDEILRAQILAKQLDAKEADLKKQDAFYREQVARLEERSAQFYKVTTENYRKAADQVNAKFKRYEVNPVCADLQGQVLSCYKENAGKTLNCSNIAALYLQCVNNAKQNDKHVQAPSWTDDVTS
ncbi:coiled-coil-helix-coiled-coil-helix domain containing 3a isoform X1 [Nothobranchius furzeri]|uniref:Coiled-coil-helix-coiled-coil-helix domain containing 3 n=2 Tax=Nothobranchius furzeri TaxID=105023 RepID=A0A1A8AF47_NOTFU|nr:coiled-coil-helix-coiled-coil-helix domain containing 3a isoform X1 [Nothobranchius furzeri]